MHRTKFRLGFVAAVTAALGVFVLTSGAAQADLVPLTPDLTVTNAGIKPLPGGKTDVFITVRNVGSAAAPASTHVVWFQGKTHTGQSTLAGGALAVGQQQTYKITLLYSLPAGEYLVGGCADIYKEVAELLESNNCLSKSANVP